MIRSAAKPIIKFSNSLYYFSNKIQLSHTIGAPFNDPIKLSTAQVLLQMTQKYPNKIGLNCYEQNISLTYQQITQKTLRVANSLIKDFDIKPKDRIGIYAFNKWQWYIIQLANSFVDGILVNINPSYKSQQLAYTLDKVRVKLLFVSDQFKNSNYLDIVRETIPEIKDKNVHPFQLSSKKFPFLKSVVRFNAQGLSENVHGFVNFTKLLDHRPTTEALPKAWPDCHDQTNIQFTSGTTGLPKAATLSHYNILNNGYAIGKRLKLTQKDNICIPVPLYHCFGMVLGNLAGLVRGATLTYVGEGFDPKKTLQSINKYQCTALYGVPTMFSQYLRIYQQNPKLYDISKLRTGIIAGSLAPQKLMNQILNTLKIKEITNCYGMTQTSPVSFQTSIQDTFIRKTTTVGSILEGLQGKIINPQTLQTCPVGTPGEFVVKGWVNMSGYWQDTIANQKTFIDNQWVRSGDLGVFDDEGYLTIVGRIKDMIIRGGQNVYPKEIEEFINKNLPGALDVQIVGIPDEKYGEQIFALIKVSDLNKNQLTKQDILSLCKGKIAHYKIPKFVKFVQSLPLTVTGKPQKYIMRQSIKQEQKQVGLSQYAIR